MRIRITLDDDAYQLASLYAAGHGISLGAAIGELVRKAIAKPAYGGTGIKTAPNGLPVFPSRGRVITPKMMKDALGG
jgi:hypothetical protein